MAFFGKTYKLEKQENYEEFVNSFVGDSEERKTYLLNYKPNQRLEKDGDGYTLVLIFGDKEKRVSFKSGVAFQEDLKTVKLNNVYTVEGNILTQEIKGDEGDSVVIIVKKEFSDDKLEETITNTKVNVTAKKYYSA